MAVPTTESAADPGAPDPPAPAPALDRGWVALVARAVAASGGGLLLYLSFPPRTLWWLAVPALALLGLAVHGRRARAGFGYGFLFGFGFLLPLLTWIGALVGPVPWVALVVFESLFVGLAGVGLALVSRLPAAPLWAAAVWVAGEALRGRVPFGGLPWGRVGFGQPDGILLPVASIGGEPLLSFVTVLAGLTVGELLRRAAQRTLRPLVVPAVIAVAALLSGPVAALVPPTGGGPARFVTVAAVQGNVPRLGLDFNAQRRAVLDNHVKETIKLADEVAAGIVAKPDIVIWPENSSDIDPLRNPDAAAVIVSRLDALHRPVTRALAREALETLDQGEG